MHNAVFLNGTLNWLAVRNDTPDIQSTLDIFIFGLSSEFFLNETQVFNGP
jgi:hypothetical protein